MPGNPALDLAREFVPVAQNGAAIVGEFDLQLEIVALARAAEILLRRVAVAADDIVRLAPQTFDGAARQPDGSRRRPTNLIGLRKDPPTERARVRSAKSATPPRARQEGSEAGLTASTGRPASCSPHLALWAFDVIESPRYDDAGVTASPHSTDCPVISPRRPRSGNKIGAARRDDAFPGRRDWPPIPWDRDFFRLKSAVKGRDRSSRRAFSLRCARRSDRTGVGNSHSSSSIG